MDLEDKKRIAAALHKAASDRAVAALRSRMAQTTPAYTAQPQPAGSIAASTWPMNPAGTAHDGLASALPEPTTAAVIGAWPAWQATSTGLYGCAQRIASTSTAAGPAPETEQAKIDRILDALQMSAVPQRGAASGTASQLSAQTMQTLVLLGANARIKHQSCSEFIESAEDTVLDMMQAPGKAADSALLYHRLVVQPECQAHMQQKQAAARDTQTGLPTGHHAPQAQLPPRLQLAQVPIEAQAGLAAGIAGDTWGASLLGHVTKPAASRQQQQQQHPDGAMATNLLAPTALDDVWGADPHPCTPTPALSPIGGLAQLHPADMDSLMAMFVDSPGHAAAAATTGAAALPSAAAGVPVRTGMHQVLMPSGWAQAAACSPRGTYMRSTAAPSTPRGLLGGHNQGTTAQAYGSMAASDSTTHCHHGCMGVPASDGTQPGAPQQSDQLAAGQDASRLNPALPTVQAVQRQGPASGSKDMQPLQQLRSLQQQRAYVAEQLHAKQQQQQVHVQEGQNTYNSTCEQAAESWQLSQQGMSPRMSGGSGGGGHHDSMMKAILAKRMIVRQSDASSNSTATTFTPAAHSLGACPMRRLTAPCAEHAAAEAVAGPAPWLHGSNSKRPEGEYAQQQRPAKVPKFDITSTAGSAAPASDTSAIIAATLDTGIGSAWEQPNALVQRAIAAAEQQQQQQQLLGATKEQWTDVSKRVDVGEAAVLGDGTAVDMAQLPPAFRKYRGPILFL